MPDEPTVLVGRIVESRPMPCAAHQVSTPRPQPSREGPTADLLSPEAQHLPIVADVSRLMRREQIFFFVLGTLLAVPLNILAAFLYVLIDSALR